VSPVEAALGLRAWSGGSLAFTGGAALGLHHGVGASDVRIFLGVAWAPRARPQPVRTVESAEVAEQLPAEPAAAPSCAAGGRHRRRRRPRRRRPLS
jgi:hypothetical protein